MYLFKNASNIQFGAKKWFSRLFNKGYTFYCRLLNFPTVVLHAEQFRSLNIFEMVFQCKKLGMKKMAKGPSTQTQDWATMLHFSIDFNFFFFYPGTRNFFILIDSKKGWSRSFKTFCRSVRNSLAHINFVKNVIINLK